MSKSNIGFYLGKKRKFFVFFLRVLQIFIISLEGVLLVFISNDTWACSENIWKRVMTPPPPKFFIDFGLTFFFFLFQFQQWRRRWLCACALLWSKLFWFWIWVLNLNFLLYTMNGINSFQYDMSWSSEKWSDWVWGGEVKH